MAVTRILLFLQHKRKIPLPQWNHGNYPVIPIYAYQEASEYIRCAYEPVSYLCPDVDPNSDSSDDGSSDEEIKYQENLYYK